MSKTPKHKPSDADEEFMFHLYDHDKCKSIDCTARVVDGHLVLNIDGYGDHCSDKNDGWPIMVEPYEGKLRVILWSDINQEDPTTKLRF